MDTYEKKYKEALERARQLCAYPTTKPFISDLQDLFPELKDEDERIRKDIATYLKSTLSNKKYGDKVIESWIAWLEKQGWQKSAVDTKVIIPKFRVGDIVKSKSQPMLSPRKIISIGKDCYWCEDRGCIGFAWEDDLELVEQKPADWIQELEYKLSKATPEQLAEWKEKYFKVEPAWSEKGDEQKPVSNIQPKFKQGDIVREKETGILFYVNSVEDFGYTLHYKDCAEKGCILSFKYEDNYELVKQASDWSEKDENMLKSLICTIEANKVHFSNTTELEKVYDDYLSWLKSLRPQSQWRPSDEQIEALEKILKYFHMMNAYEETIDGLKELLEQLKKLREE